MTTLNEAINYLLTGGDTDHTLRNFADQDQITFKVDTASMTFGEQLAFRDALDRWADLIDIPFVETSNDLEANMILSFGSYPGGAAGTTVTPPVGPKLVLLNREAYPIGSDTVPGSAAFRTMMHELGHALGLTHPGNYNHNPFDDEPITYGVDNVFPEDNAQFTLMSYFDLFEVEAHLGRYTAWWDYASPSTPMLFDIAAVQSLYGANRSTRSGNDTYGFNATNGFAITNVVGAGSAEVFTIWDGGGIDTIDASGAESRDGSSVHYIVSSDPSDDSPYPNQIIDLREGAFSSIGLDKQANAAFPQALENNVAIAFGVVIENAIGGEGHDLLQGNSVANRLVGNGGHDVIFGDRGNDTILGGAGDDSLYGGDDNDQLTIGSGSNGADGGAGNDTIFANEGGADTLVGGAGHDIVTYEGATSGLRRTSPGTTIPANVQTSYTLIAEADEYDGIEEFRLTQSIDVFEGTSGGETINALGGNDYIIAAGGSDNVIGETGDDTLFGGSGADTLDGGVGNDSLVGGDGDDQLIGGGLGSIDTMSGGAGNDTYFVDSAADVVSEAALGLLPPGDDLIISSISLTLAANVERLTLSGAAPLSGTGNSLANTITGNGAANTLDGGTNADTLVGRGGNDTYIVDNAGDVVDESTGSFFDVDTVQASVSYSLADTTRVLGAVENLTLTGTVGLTGTGSATANIVTGNSGGNLLLGLTGNDTMDGGAGADTMFGGNDNDTYIVDSTGDVVNETSSDGTDTIRSALAIDLSLATRVVGSVENATLLGTSSVNVTGNTLANVLTGNSGANTLNGDAGNDTLEGGLGSDTLNGGTGNDTYRYSGTFGIDRISDAGGSDAILVAGSTQLNSVVRSSNNLVLSLSTGTLTIVNHFTTGTIESLTQNGGTVVLATGLIGGDLAGIITGTDQSETLDGRGGNDLLFGNLGNDLLIGGLGDDSLQGGSGRDTVDGGFGNDLLGGGHGRDVFVFDRGYGHDTISDFQFFQDTIEFNSLGAPIDIDISRSGITLDFGGGDVLDLQLGGFGGLASAFLFGFTGNNLLSWLDG